MSTKHYDLSTGEFLALVLIAVLAMMNVVILYQGNGTHKQLTKILAKPKDTITVVIKQEKLVIPVNITSYNATKEQCNGISDSKRTASGHIIKTTDSIIGVSKDLIKFTTLHFGDTVTLWTANRHGRYVIHDLGNVRLNHTADVLLFTKDHFCEEGTISITR